VAQLPFIQASRSDLIAELMQEESTEEGHEEQEVVLPPANTSSIGGIMRGDLQADQLKALAAKKLGSGGLKLAAGLDAASLAQTRLDMSPAVEEATERQASGLNIKRRQ